MLQRVIIVLVVLVALALLLVLPGALQAPDGDRDVPPIRLRPDRGDGG